jgi:hypothetical protein
VLKVSDTGVKAACCTHRAGYKRRAAREKVSDTAGEGGLLCPLRATSGGRRGKACLTPRVKAACSHLGGSGRPPLLDLLCGGGLERRGARHKGGGMRSSLWK